MNKTIMLALGVIVTVGVGYVVITGVSNKSGGMPGTSGTNQTINGSMKDLIAQGKSLKCVFDNTVDVGKTSGTIYIGNGKLHGDYNVTQTGSAQVIEAHMTINGPTMYYWMKGQQQGFKIPFDVNSSAKQNNAPSAIEQFNAKFNYNCAPWAVDESVFALPAGLTFADMGNIVPTRTNTQVMPTGGVAPTDAQKCAACEQIPDASAKAQCKLILHCK